MITDIKLRALNYIKFPNEQGNTATIQVRQMRQNTQLHPISPIPQKEKEEKRDHTRKQKSPRT